MSEPLAAGFSLLELPGCPPDKHPIQAKTGGYEIAALHTHTALGCCLDSCESPTTGRAQGHVPGQQPGV
ncbi:MAG: hypothetical protein AB7K24_01150 [Gemmataceae bacterium]